MSHTPGPWHRNVSAKFPVYAGEAPNHVHVAFIERGPDAEANLDLVAAAPDLLSALKGLFDQCAMIHKHWGEGCNQREADAAVQQALAAIALAEGRDA